MIQPTNIIVYRYAKQLVHFIRLFFSKKCLFNLLYVLLVFLDLSQILSECTALFTQSLPSTQWNERISNVSQSWASHEGSSGK